MPAMLIVTAWIGAILGCNGKETFVPIDRVAFPVVLIVGTPSRTTIPHRADVIPSKAELSTMRVELYSALTDSTLSGSPIVIDANAGLYEMKNLKGEHGGAWIMLNPTGQMPIRFDLLQRKESGIESVRVLIGECTYLGRDLDQDRSHVRRERIRKATKMTEIMRIIDEIPIVPNASDQAEASREQP